MTARSWTSRHAPLHMTSRAMNMTSRVAQVFAVASSLLLSAIPAHADRSAGDVVKGRQLEAQGKFAGAESLAVAVLARLEKDPAADSLVFAGALALLADTHWHVEGYSDSVGLRAALRSLGIRARRL